MMIRSKSEHEVTVDMACLGSRVEIKQGQNRLTIRATSSRSVETAIAHIRNLALRIVEECDGHAT